MRRRRLAISYAKLFFKLLKQVEEKVKHMKAGSYTIVSKVNLKHTQVRQLSRVVSTGDEGE